jgi:hypothetical protein
MTIRKAIEQNPAVRHAYCRGMGALRETDRMHVTVRHPRRLTGSIDLDTALKTAYPDSPRWDYGIGYSDKQETIFWLEIHPASSTHVDEVLRKYEWLKNWLQTQAAQLDSFPRKFVWIASGKVSLQLGSPQRKKLASRGIFFAGRSFSI